MTEFCYYQKQAAIIIYYSFLIPPHAGLVESFDHYRKEIIGKTCDDQNSFWIRHLDSYLLSLFYLPLMSAHGSLLTYAF